MKTRSPLSLLISLSLTILITPAANARDYKKLSQNKTYWSSSAGLQQLKWLEVRAKTRRSLLNSPVSSYNEASINGTKILTQKGGKTKLNATKSPKKLYASRLNQFEASSVMDKDNGIKDADDTAAESIEEGATYYDEPALADNGEDVGAPEADSPTDVSSTNPETTVTPDICSPGGDGGGSIDAFKSAMEVMEKGIIPAKQKYDRYATNWPTLKSTGDGKLTVTFGPEKKSMCTSATAAAFHNYIANLVNAGKLKLNTKQLNFLNGSFVKNALNGNTWSMAKLYEFFGGESIVGKGSKSNIAAALKQAKPGDILKFDRKFTVNGKQKAYGHSTIFKEFKNNKVCFWSSNKGTNGVAERCEPLDNKFIDVAISRFPSDLQNLPARIDKMIGESKNSSSRLARAFSGKNADRTELSSLKLVKTFTNGSTQVACADTPDHGIASNENDSAVD